MQDRRCDEVLTAVRRIIRATDLHSRSLALRYGLTGPQLMVLLELQRYPEISVGELARDISLSPATVTDILDRLEKRGLIQRARSDVDRRRVRLTMTGEGQRMLEMVPTVLQQRFVDEFERLEDWEQTLLLSSLQRLASMMELPALETALFSEEGVWHEQPRGEDAKVPLAPLEPTS